MNKLPLTARLRQRLDQERGATLFIIAMVIVILLLAGGVAVDISAKANRGQDLQNAADGAALHAAQTLATRSATNPITTGDIDAAVADLMAANGFGSEVDFVVSYPGAGGFNGTVVNVEVTDPAYIGLLSVITGQEPNGVTRDATADQEVPCNEGCNREVSPPPIFVPVETFGSGDGFVPFVVGDKLYSVNHHQRFVTCIDALTGEKCFNGGANSEAPAFITPGVTTNSTHHAAPIGTRIFYSGSTTKNVPATTVVTCFDTLTNQPCPQIRSLDGEGRVTTAVFGNRVYAFSESLRVFCYEAPNLSTCSGWDALGRATSLEAISTAEGWTGYNNQIRNAASAGNPALNRIVTNVWFGNMKIVGDKIYTTHRQFNDAWVQCFDTTTEQACTNFTPRSITGGNQPETLLVHRDTNGNPNAICQFGRDEVACYNLTTGADLGGPTSAIERLRVQQRTFTHTETLGRNTKSSDGSTQVGGNNVAPWDVGWGSISTWHPPTNRLFTTDARNSVTHCLDFNTSQLCNAGDASLPSSVYNKANVDIGGTTVSFEIETYGFMVGQGDNENCLIGLGDESVFFTLKPDLSGPCDDTGGTVLIEPCGCLTGAGGAWPIVETGEIEGVLAFEVRVVEGNDPTGQSPQVAPSDPSLIPDAEGNTWHNLLDGPLDLNNPLIGDPVTGSFNEATLVFNIQIDTANGFDGENVTFVVRGVEPGPRLVE